MLIQTWPVLRVFWHDILPHSTATEYGLLLFSRPHVSKTPTILHEKIERQAAHLSYHASESQVSSLTFHMAMWFAILRRWKPCIYNYICSVWHVKGMCVPWDDHSWLEGYNPCSRNPFTIKPNRQLFPRKENYSQETTSPYYYTKDI